MEPGKHQLSFFDLVLAHPMRERLLIESPALLLFLYQHLVSSRCAGVRVPDPLAQGTRRTADAVSELLRMPTNDAILLRAFASTEPGVAERGVNEEAVSAPSSGASDAFWFALQRVLVAAWTPAAVDDEAHNEAVRYLCTVGGKVHFLFSPESGPCGGLPLQPTTLQNTLNVSRDFLRTATSCALAGSAAAVASVRRFQALLSIMEYERLLPTPSEASTEPVSSPTTSRAARSSRRPASPTAASAAEGDVAGAHGSAVTSEGINFCMLSLQQQWWVLVNGALDRVLVKAQQSPHTEEVVKPHLWQLLAVLVMLDGTRLMFAFPDEAEDFTGFHLLMRLGEIGLLYGIRTTNGDKAFAVSPHLAHALEWTATAPCCLTSMAEASGAQVGSDGGTLRREDTDTIITETNFRLYAYTQSEDLLNIIDMFADRERVQTTDGEKDERISDVLVVYTVTRESFLRAIRKGITAAQVLHFLSLKAHPSMLQQYGEDPHAAAPADGNGGDRATGGGGHVSGQTLAVPQSFCDRLLMWENECHRVTFHHRLVLLKNVSPEQADWLAQYLQDVGEADAIVHAETGHVVVKEDVYDRYLAGSVTEA